MARMDIMQPPGTAWPLVAPVLVLTATLIGLPLCHARSTAALPRMLVRSFAATVVAGFITLGLYLASGQRMSPTAAVTEAAVAGFAAALTTASLAPRIPFGGLLAWIIGWLLLVYAPLSGLLHAAPLARDAAPLPVGWFILAVAVSALLLALRITSPRNEALEPVGRPSQTLAGGLVMIPASVGLLGAHLPITAIPLAMVNTQLAMASGAIIAMSVTASLTHATARPMVNGALAAFAALSITGTDLTPGEAILTGAMSSLICTLIHASYIRTTPRASFSVPAIYGPAAVHGLLISASLRYRTHDAEQAWHFGVDQATSIAIIIAWSAIASTLLIFVLRRAKALPPVSFARVGPHKSTTRP